MTTPIYVFAGALLTGVLLTGCAQAAPAPGVTATPGVSSSPTPMVRLSTGNEITLTGTVEHLGIEGGCTVLRVDSTNKVYELKGGDPQVLKVGTHVSVKGKIRNDLATVCQIGPVLEVISSQVA